MEILLLFILNIFTGALIYLLLSLKIERNSTTYQEQKLKKEMGEIITEFNSTAERNITLLEARISVLKRLMGESGTLKSMDITMEHKPEIEKILQDSMHAGVKVKKSASSGNELSGDRIITKNAADITGIGFNGAFADDRPMQGRAAGSTEKKKDLKNAYVQAGIFTEERGRADSLSRGGRVDFVSDEDIEMAPGEPSPAQSENPSDLFQTTENKYSLIAELHGKGYSVEDLAVYSGLPAGEVRLVISLNKQV